MQKPHCANLCRRTGNPSQENVCAISEDTRFTAEWRHISAFVRCRHSLLMTNSWPPKRESSRLSNRSVMGWTERLLSIPI